MTDWFDWIALALSVAAAGFGFRAATVVVRESMDHFIGDLRRQGRWAGLAAIFAALAVVAQVVARAVSS